ncbi:diacylglycerol kinase [Blastococcus sp. CT_GayMR20]|uniref:diacylglycerol/lipid kinase family protein n=1 Tax=Blastococcus sp. CT_GayMR20 TaxID=2559609 RepID=UPI00107464A4|nr:diacylglycerol kinase family protein [Blastococcus sp. CT_GayMR20]TFV88200.1 diacylglycerol kinase [Blastococcus sp. CT_GayMR20]
MRTPRTPAARRRRRTTGRRTAAVLALLGALWMLNSAVAVAVDDFPRGLLVAVCGLVVAAGAWEGVLRRGWGRVAGLAVAGAALAVAALLLVDEGFQRDLVLLVLGALIWHVGARLAFQPRVSLDPVERPRRPVLFVNPRSGGGKATRFRLAEEARERGITPVEMAPGDDLAELVRTALDDGADALAMAGGDGSQAIVAAAAAEAGRPYACVPSGTRNHFALDLGVDRDDVVGALDAFVDGGERVVDLAEVNGRVFVNNVSLGVYAEAVQRPGYRAAKVRTLLGTASLVLGTTAGAQDMRWTTPGGRTMHGAAVILVGNNQYRLGGAAGAGTRPAVDRGELGISVVDPPSTRTPHRRKAWRQWTAPEFRVESAQPLPAGVDGEAVLLASPVEFRVRPAALRVRIAAHHPGASPSSVEPVGAFPALRALARIAVGRNPQPAEHTPAAAPAGRIVG